MADICCSRRERTTAATSRSGSLIALLLVASTSPWLLACHGSRTRPLASISGSTSSSPEAPAPAPGGGGRTFHVGPGQRFATIGAVPWYALQAGDTVYIHYKPTPYREKMLISGAGTASRWIRVLGVPGPKGERPAISGDGATTSRNMHHRWQDAVGGSAIQHQGVVQIAVNSGEVLPQYIEIAGLEVRDAGNGYSFSAENGAVAPYDGFAACIYARSVRHLLVRDNVLHNCGNGFYNWSGDGSEESWWAGLQVDTVLRGNHFYDNGAVGDYSMHQIYSESDRVVIEQNWIGPPKPGMRGSQIKDRSAGTIIRYNYVEQSPEGWDFDLVEPENSWRSLGSKPYYGHDFVYGNIVVNRNRGQNYFHWNEDHQSSRGRANQASGKLAVYHNTIVMLADGVRPDGGYDLYDGVSLFNGQWGGYECPEGPLPGVIDLRNNLVVSVKRTGSAAAVPWRLGWCGGENFHLGTNWISPGWSVTRAARARFTGKAEGEAEVVSGGRIAFADLAAAQADVHVLAGSASIGRGGALAPEVTNGSLPGDLRPAFQYGYDQRLEPRRAAGGGSDLGALGR